MANTAFVALLSGLSASWIQFLAFAVAKTKLPAEIIRRLLLALIEELRECQLFVKAVVCDQGTSNVQLFDLLNLTQQNPFFLVGGEKAYFLFDTPHLIKCNRQGKSAIGRVPKE